MNILALGDIHLQCWPKNVPQNYSAWDSIFAQVTNYAEEHDVDTTVQLGDVFDMPCPNDETWFYFLNAMASSPLKWILYNGNHDYADAHVNSFNDYLKLQQYGLLKNVQFILEPTSVNIGKDFVHILPWPNYDTKHVKEPSLVFAHFAAPGARADTGIVLKESHYSPKFGKHEWVIGDLHTYQRDKSKRYIYPGAALQFKYNDSPNKYFLHITGKFPYSIKRIPIKLPYLLEQHTLIAEDKHTDNILRKLQLRPEITYSKVKLASNLYSTSVLDKLQKMPRMLIEPISRKDVKEEQDTVKITAADSKSIRRSLTIDFLRKSKFDKNAIKRALHMVQQMEKAL